MEYVGKNIQFYIDKDMFKIKKNDKLWKSNPSFKSKIVLQSGREILFESAKQREEVFYENEIGFYALTRYRDLKGVNFAFDTLVWIEKISGDIYFEWIPVNDNGFEIKEIVWPASIVEENGFTILPCKEDTNTGMFHTLDANVNFLAHIEEDKNAFIVLNETGWDSYFSYYKEIQMHWLPSLGKMQYKRKLRYVFLSNMTKEDIYDWYRQYESEKGNILRKNTVITEKIDTMFLTGAKNCIQNSDGSFHKRIVCESTLLPYIRTIEYGKVLDVSDLICNPLQECIHPHHKMTRKECMEERIKILKYLKAIGKTLVSKRCTVWAYPYVDAILEEKDSVFADVFM